MLCCFLIEFLERAKYSVIKRILELLYLYDTIRYLRFLVEALITNINVIILVT